MSKDRIAEIQELVNGDIPGRITSSYVSKLRAGIKRLLKIASDQDVELSRLPLPRRTGREIHTIGSRRNNNGLDIGTSIN